MTVQEPETGGTAAPPPKVVVGNDTVRVEFMIDDLIRQIKSGGMVMSENCNGCNSCHAAFAPEETTDTGEA